jgi:hypothetical protein
MLNSLLFVIMSMITNIICTVIYLYYSIRFCESSYLLFTIKIIIIDSVVYVILVYIYPYVGQIYYYNIIEIVFQGGRFFRYIYIYIYDINIIDIYCGNRSREFNE